MLTVVTFFTPGPQVFGLVTTTRTDRSDMARCQIFVSKLPATPMAFKIIAGKDFNNPALPSITPTFKGFPVWFWV